MSNEEVFFNNPKKFLKENPKVDALFLPEYCINDENEEMVQNIAYLQKRIKIISTRNEVAIPGQNTSTIGIPCVNINTKEVGRQAMLRLLWRIEHPFEPTLKVLIPSISPDATLVK